MAKYKLQEMPSLNGVGEKRVYPKMVTHRQMDTHAFFTLQDYADMNNLSRTTAFVFVTSMMILSITN